MLTTRRLHRQTLVHTAKFLSRNFRESPSSSFAIGQNVRQISTTIKLNGVVRQEQKGPVSYITMDRPKQKNAFNKEMWEELTGAIIKSSGDDSTNIIVLGGSSDSFSTGLDFQEYREASKSSNLPAYSKGVATNLRKFAATLIDCKKPIVALVQGSAFGVGVTLLPLCDFAFASDKVLLLTPFGRLGIVAECCSSYTFPKIMGYAKASSILYANRMINAHEALTSNLVSDVIAHHEFNSKTDKLIQGIASLPIKSLMYSKELVRGPERKMLHEANIKETEGIELFLQSPQTETAVNKFFDDKKK